MTRKKRYTRSRLSPNVCVTARVGVTKNKTLNLSI